MRVIATELVELDKIRLNGETQPREEIDEATVESYADLLDAGVELPAVDVFYDGAVYWLADGFHRWHASRRAQHEKIMCKVRQGTKEDAQWFAASANQKHGLRRSVADKQKAVRMALANPSAEGLSDNKIAEHVGVSNRMVAKYRESLTMKVSESNTTSAGKATPRKGRDNRTINTANIGKGKGGKKPKKPAKDQPPIKSLTGRDHDLFVARQQVQTYIDALARWVKEIDDFRKLSPSKAGDNVITTIKMFDSALKAWKKAIK